jgi:hypothetical protein
MLTARWRRSTSSAKFHFTETNAYSGNNGRAAILSKANGADFYYTAGNAGNGGNPEPTGIVLGAGTQIIDPSEEPERLQAPGLPTPVGTFNITDLGDKADKFGKDDNFRGPTISITFSTTPRAAAATGSTRSIFLTPPARPAPTA